jgi:D-alanyl-lipoteichoic acid acyltransferase DltB (MBOAT superfamily)
MLFNSIYYVIFLPLVVLVYYLAPVRFRWLWLLGSSYFFYMSWQPAFALLILLTTVIDYFGALEMEKARTREHKRLYLSISLLSNLTLLLVFRYAGLLSQPFRWLSLSSDPEPSSTALDLLVPVGLAFYTLQSISYMIDVFRGDLKAEKHFGYYALYMSFFPKLVAGPIERFGPLMRQFRQTVSWDSAQVVNGLRLILYGYFLKMVVADQLGSYVDRIYTSWQLAGSSDILLAWTLYSFQVYSDFLGYTLIATGSALILGIRLSENFRSPLLAGSVSGFLKRWNITLYAWFRDYLYRPAIARSRFGWQRSIGLILVFLAGGLWYRADAGFILPATFFMLFFLVEKKLKIKDVRNKSRVPSPVQLVRAALVFIPVTMAWVFFRSESLATTGAMFRQVFSNFPDRLQQPVDSLIWIILAIFFFLEFWLYNNRYDRAVSGLPVSVRWLSYIVLLLCIAFFSALDPQPFIFYRF